ncbi:MAG: hypothetical protein KatS3mg008_1736 [Acidimicrobiales bacterium]|nr:MAG: hypothetical protein KatS3mg008_1736 [Acidimicrobiales bacterium]
MLNDPGRHSAFEDARGYAVQRVVIAAQGSVYEESFNASEAMGFVISDGAVDPDLVRSHLLEVLLPADFIIEDRRQEHKWGASGPLSLDFFIGIASSFTAATVYETLKYLLKRAVRSKDSGGHIQINADSAWMVFTRFVELALDAKPRRAIQLERREGHWFILADTSRGEVEGVIDAGGEICAARLRSEGEGTINWPPTLTS